MKLTQFLFVAVALCRICAIPGYAEEPKELDQLRFEFQVELAELIRPVQELNGKYRGYLEKQKAEYQQAGNLKAMLEVDGELKISEKESGEVLSSFPELNRLQGIYRNQRAKLENELSDRKLALIQAYRKKAGDLAAEWTRAGKIDEAKLALAESERFVAMEKDADLLKKAGETAASGPAARNAANFEGSTAGEVMKNSLRMELCWIPAGKFTMGSPENEVGRVEVELTRGFWLGKYEVTQEEFEAVMRINPARFKDVGKRAPVEQVTWEESMAFCKALTERERKRRNLPEDWAYTLPTEAQWEYACRAGETGPFSGGELDEVGWYRNNSEGKTHEVGQKKANAWGLHDMHGNVREWCADWFADNLTGGKDPTGPASGSERVRRDGDWSNEARGCQAFSRGGRPPSALNSTIGLRVCLCSTQ